ncbi:MAG: endolytic transglycosylase MltG [Xanthobacteraceae bacterium]|nr:endolytic transglycosylase MltG [Xanthobacteraceae bacterium]
MLWRRKQRAVEQPASTSPADRVPDADSGRDPNSAAQSAADRARAIPRSARAALQPDKVPMPKRRSQRARHPIVVAGNAFFTVLVVLAIGVGVGVLVIKSRLTAPGPLQEDKVVNVARAGVSDLADTLQHEGVIDQQWPFFIRVWLNKARGNDVKAGEYQFAKHASVEDVINTLSEGKVVQHAITIPEGLTSEQIVQRLLDMDFLAGNIKSIPPEGSLLPETYRFPRSTPREQVLQRMQREQRDIVQKTWAARAPDLPLKSPAELVTLASIVEKETGRPEERSRVASVFVNRLKQRMRLQSDPTIIYGLVGGKGSLGRPISRSDITQPTPYNTYTIDGLPPGPIANPGRASLEAAANPARTKDLYFVADGTGGHAFSETLDAHQKNVAHLRAIEQGDAASAAPEPASTTAADTSPPPKPRATRTTQPSKPKPATPQVQNQNGTQPGSPARPQ